MGYRSQVAIVIQFETKEDAANYLATFDNEDAKWLKPEQTGRFLSFEENWLKWYEEYEDVAYATKFYQKSDTAPGFVSYKFARIGEDDADYEEHVSGDGWGLIDYERALRIYHVQED